MRFSTLMRRPADWMVGAGPESHIVLTSRIRLARNVRSFVFPGWAKKDERRRALDEIQPSILELAEMQKGFVAHLGDLEKLQKQVLVERHLISREHAARGEGCALVADRSQRVSIMINEEDHLRLQIIRPGLNFKEAWTLADSIDDQLERRLDYAFDNEWGYLTACPSNLGTGLRASAMLHLPGLVLSEEIGRVIKGVNKLSLAVRGLYGEGTEALGHLFQISNQSTLGEDEATIIKRLEGVLARTVKAEKDAREKLIEDKPTMLADQIARAHAILSQSHILTSKEALHHLSMLRLVRDLGRWSCEDEALLDMLLLEIQPAHLQLEAGKELDAHARDAMRAEITRRRLQSTAAPDTCFLESSGNGGNARGAKTERKNDE
jgi:protein arginine kinase